MVTKVPLRRLVVPASAAALLLVGLAGAAPGDLDPSFGTGGIVTTPIDPGDAEVKALVIQEDVRLVTAGFVRTGIGSSDFALARYRPDGALDTSFGGDGIVTISFSDSDRAEGLVVQPDGKLVVAGDARVQRSAIVRYNPDGSLDETFGHDGIVRPDFEFHPYALALQADGKLVAAGLTYRRIGHFALIRLNSDGSLDATFGKDGIATAAIGRHQNVPLALLVQADGRLVAAGYSWKKGGSRNSAFALGRFNPDGSLDTTFSGDGKVLTEIAPEDDRVEALALQEDGKLVAAGWTGTPGISPVRFALARYNPDGKLDASFSGDGKLTTSIGSGDYARAVVAQPNGKLVAAGESSKRFALVRYRSDGTLDPSFGGDGIVLTPIGQESAARALARQNDGKLVAAGRAKSPSTIEFEFALARYGG